MRFKYIPTRLEILNTDSSITKRVKFDYNTLPDVIFFRKYSASKCTYFKRVLKYGDPYMNSPLAKIGKILIELQKHM